MMKDRSIFLIRFLRGIISLKCGLKMGPLFLFYFLCIEPLALAETVQADYKLSLMGLPIGMAHLSMRRTDPTYEIEAHARLTGLSTLLASLDIKAQVQGNLKEVHGNLKEAQGNLKDMHLSPNVYNTISRTTQNTQQTQISWSDEKVKTIEMNPPLKEEPDRVPLSEDFKIHVLDPLSATMILLDKQIMNKGEKGSSSAAAGGFSCDQTLPIFDGTARFDLQLVPPFEEKKDPLPKIEGHPFSGSILHCSVRYQPLAGHRPGKSNVKFLSESKKIGIWLASQEPLRFAFPYRISLPTRWGAGVLELTHVDIQP